MSGNMDKWNDDPRLTAFALGELEPAEAEEIARAVEADPEVSRSRTKSRSRTRSSPRSSVATRGARVHRSTNTR